MRRKKLMEKKIHKKRSFLPLILITLFLLSISIFFVGLRYSTWDKTNKFTFLTLEPNGDVKVTVIDPNLTEKTQIIIPGDTEVSVSRNYGLLRLKNVWQLGINEKIGGKLLTETVTKNFLFPVSYWWNEDGTNINLIDKFSLGFYMKKINSVDINTIDMAKSQYLKKIKLADGETGYKLQGQVSTRLTSYFSDNELVDQNIKINIVDLSGKSGVSENLGAILEVIGGKIVSIERKEVSNDLDCEVSGKSQKAVENASNLFDCAKIVSESSFDLEIKIGKKFASRF